MIAVIGVLLSSWLQRSSRNYQTVGGKAFRPVRSSWAGHGRSWAPG
ncbi:hypothetical protein ACFQV4_29495 [Streptomyces thermocarboxydus]